MKQVRSFDDILGSEKLTAYIRESAAKGTIPHAVMLVGEEGSGKKTFARLFSKTIQCEKRAAAGAGPDTADPCMECQSCRQVDAGQHPDIVMIGPDEGKKTRTISVKTIRGTIAEGAFIKPYKGPFKIYIVERAESMTVEAQNALLKILEEPPAYIVIILLSTDEESLLDTVRSRCVIFHTGAVDQDLIQQYLQDELMVPDYLARPAARFARGNIGKAAQLVSSTGFRELYDQVVQYFEKARFFEFDRILEIEEELAKDMPGCEQFLDLVHLYLRDILTVKCATGGDLFFADEAEKVEEAASRLSFKAVDEIHDGIFTVRERIEQNVAPDMALEVLLALIKEKML